MTVILAILLAFQPVLVAAQDRYRLPPGKRLTVQQQTYQGYSLEEFKVLLKMDVDLESFSQQIPKYVKLVVDQTELSTNLTKQLELKSKIIKVLEGERTRLTKKWTEENRLRHLAENKISWTTWFAWGAAGAATLVATVLAMILVVKDSK